MVNKVGIYFKVIGDNYDFRIESTLELFLNMENYYCHIIENDVLTRINNDWHDNYRFLGDKEFEMGSKLKEELKEIEDYYPIFFNLEAYPHEVPIDEMKNTSINNIQEFLDSKCHLKLVIIDCYEIAIFVKNIEDFPNIQQEIVSKGYGNFRFIDKSEAWRI